MRAAIALQQPRDRRGIYFTLFYFSADVRRCAANAEIYFIAAFVTLLHMKPELYSRSITVSLVVQGLATE